MEKSNTCSCGIANPWLQIELRSAFQPNGLELPNAAVPAATALTVRHLIPRHGIVLKALRIAAENEAPRALLPRAVDLPHVQRLPGRLHPRAIRILLVLAGK